jgi:hypothetical protein
MDKVDRARVLEAFNDRDSFAAFLHELHEEWRASSVTLEEYTAGQVPLDDRAWMAVRLMLALSDLAALRTKAEGFDAVGAALVEAGWTPLGDDYAAAVTALSRAFEHYRGKATRGP